jgi:hypothetical protein
MTYQRELAGSQKKGKTSISEAKSNRKFYKRRIFTKA